MNMDQPRRRKEQDFLSKCEHVGAVKRVEEERGERKQKRKKIAKYKQ